MNLTGKQQEVLCIAAKRNPDGSPTDLDEIIERASYKPTKPAIQFTIRALIQHGLMEKAGKEVRRDRMRVLLQATALGQHYANAYRPSLAAALIED